MDLVFQFPEETVAECSEAVLETLEFLKCEFEYDETSPSDENGETTYKVVGVKLPKN
jgi:hypothetical protein